jgi:hypothetical protein
MTGTSLGVAVIHDFDMARAAVAIGLAAWRSVRESRPVRLAEMT